MGFALTDVCGFRPATYAGRPIPEKDLASGGLGKFDTHFGINGDVSAIVNDGDINTYGPRAIDLNQRGGIVAETLWNKWQDNPSDSDVSGFLTFFEEVGGKKAPKNTQYPVGAKISGVDVGGDEKYKFGATNKKTSSISDENSEGAMFQLGTRWSKVALEHTVKNGGRIHFHLDGMGDISDLLNKLGDFNYNVTTRELRYVYRNWIRLGKSAIFYNGFSKTSSGIYKAVIVDRPW
ncbi:hypothetical protein [Methylomonas fluvii]|uniref:Uncharacterized protein n=1 Tax=Methylomonas fluvii TaxID=1854564 RepID=A0ABR9D7S9_9GAMM|nr:hypothetical protein [Methylomonas fluvii]MBD9359157.1 hypothetical protein [Methylomonas fluvii]